MTGAEITGKRKTLHGCVYNNSPASPDSSLLSYSLQGFLILLGGFSTVYILLSLLHIWLSTLRLVYLALL